MEKQNFVEGRGCGHELKWRAIRRAAPYIGLFLLAFAFVGRADPARAQTSTNLPGVRILQGTLISVPLAESYYQSHAPLRGGVNSHTTSVPGYTRSPEVIALANGLGASQVIAGTLPASTYAQRVNEYVYNNIAVEFMFGEQKGALGAIINQSGTPFDQADLLGELLKVAGISVTYNIGTITLTAAQFTAWTGISNPVAACRLLADGGIPGSINGSTPAGCDQATLGTTLSGATMLHVWVSALGNLYDPSFKVYTTSSGIDLANAMGCGNASSPTCGSSAMSAALSNANTSNLVGTIGAISGVNQTALEGSLKTWAMNLKGSLDSSTPNAALTDVIGGRLISAAGITTPSPTLPYGTPTANYLPTDIPDLFRTTLTVQFDSINQTLFADEIAGQRLQLMGTTQGGDSTTTTRTMYLYLEFQLLASSVNSSGTTANAQLVLTANHPYAASNGAYMHDVYVTAPFIQSGYNNVQYCGQDATVCTMNNSNFFIYRTTIINSWGYTGKAALDRLRGIVKSNRFAVNLQGTSDLTAVTCLNNIYNPQGLPYGVQGIQYGPASNSVSYLGLPSCLQWAQGPLATQWLGEVSRASDLIDAVNSTTILQHHILGTLESSEWDSAGNMTFDVSSNISAVTNFNSTADRRAAIMSYAMLSSRLEGGVAEQTAGALDGQSAVSLFARGNHQNQRYAQLTSPADWGTYSGSFANYSVSNNLPASMVTTYLGAGDSLIMPQNWFTPVQTICSEGNCSGTFTNVPWPAATLSTHPSAGDSSTPDRVTLLVVGLYKGAGAVGFSDPTNTALAAVTQQQDYSLKARKYYGVDAGTGLFRLLPPPDLVTGVGGSPYSLSLERYYESNKDGQPFGVDVPPPDSTGIAPPAYGVDDSGSSASIGYGWDTNWSITATWTSDAFQGMGEDSPIDAVGAIAAVYVLRALNSSSPTLNSDMTSLYVANWMGGQFDNNALLVSRPPATDTFVRLPDGTTFNAPPHGGEQLVISGSPTGPWATGANLYMDYSPVTASLTEKDGSVLAFAATPGVQGAAVTMQPSKWTYPDGTLISFQYAPLAADVPITNSLNVATLTQVSNNLGRTLTFGSCTFPCILQVSDDAGRSVSYTATFPGQFIPGEAPTALAVELPDGGVTTYNYTSNSTQYNATRVNNVITSVVTPTNSSSFLTIGYDSLLRVATVKDAASQTTTYAVSSIAQEILHRSDVIDPLNADTTQYFDKWGDNVESIDPLGRVTTNQYDNRFRLQQTWFPEGNSTSYGYDARHNLLSTTRNPKPGSGLSATSESTQYMEGPTVSACANPFTCNKPYKVTDGNTNVTTYSWDPNTGVVTNIQYPAVPTPSGDTTPQTPNTGFGYTTCTYGSGPAVTLLQTKTERVWQGTTPAAQNLITQYTYNPANKCVLNTTAVDPSGKNLTTTFTFDGVGNLASVKDPNLNLTGYQYDSQRRLTEIDYPSSSGAKTLYTYDRDGQLTSTQKYDSTLAAYQTEVRWYYVTGDLAYVIGPNARPSAQAQGASTTLAFGVGAPCPGNFVTCYNYDADGRRVLEQVPLTSTTSRVTSTVYDLAGEVICSFRGWAGTNPAQQSDCTGWNPQTYTASGAVRYNFMPPVTFPNGSTPQCSYSLNGQTLCGYSGNGKATVVLDADGNVTQNVYDGFDRPSQMILPGSTPGSSAPCHPTWTSGDNCEVYGYDNNDNLMTKRNRSGNTVSLTYDAMNREQTRTVPNNANGHYARTVNTGYDLMGHVVTASVTGADTQSLTNNYDTAMRLSSVQDSLLGTVSYQYDANGNRTQLTWPGGSYYATFAYDGLNRLCKVREQGIATACTTTDAAGTNIAQYTWDTLSRRQGITFQNGVTEGWTYYNNSAIDTITHTIGAKSIGITLGRNQVNQITSEAVTATDPSGAMTPSSFIGTPARASTVYAPNALNQYASIGGFTAKYDLNGNLTTDGTYSYEYDEENRLRAASGPNTVTYQYDPLSRRQSKSVSGTVTQYLSDGQEQIGEYTSSGSALRYYLNGHDIDEHLAQIEASGTHYFYSTNHQGSVLASTDGSQNVSTIDYGPYGESAASPTGVAFRYTGRRLDAETGLYYYRARYYSPTLGRFLQTDPIGTKDDLNLYAYVGSDPLNKTDPRGLWNCVAGGGKQCDLVEQALAKAKSLLRKMTPKQAAAVKKVLAFYGERGDGNKVNVASGKPPGDPIAQTSTKDGVTTVTINSDIKSVDDMQRSAGTSAAGVIVHEGQHGIDETTLLHGRDPVTNQEAFDTERRAFTVESYVEQAIPYHDTGRYPLNDPTHPPGTWPNPVMRAWGEAGAKDVKPW